MSATVIPLRPARDGLWLGATPTGAQLAAMPLDRFHHAADQLERDTVPYGYWAKVTARRQADAWEVR